MVVQIPLTNDANQSFSCVIPLGNENVRLSFYISWNAVADYWAMSVSDTDTSVVYASNLPLLTGNVLKQLQYLAIGNAYVVPISGSSADNPGLNDWGVNFILAWG